MSILSTVTSGRITKPHKLVIYGPDGVGKTTFAAGAPAPIFLGAEDGTNNMDVHRFPNLKTLQSFKEALNALANEKHEFKTAVIDSLDWLEVIVWDHVVKKENKPNVTSIDDFGYGKGYSHALDEWRDLLPLVDAIRDKGMNFVAIAHTKMKTFQDPATPQGYDRYQLKLHDGAAALWRECVDTVLFANYLTHTSSEDKKRGFGEGERAIYTERRPGFDAKNRNGLPFKLEMSWEAYAEAMAKGDPEKSDTLMQQIVALKSQVKNQALIPGINKAIEKAGSSPVELTKIKSRLEATIGGA
jgi:hypothetical protein